jgi:hypothetical protein
MWNDELRKTEEQEGYLTPFPFVSVFASFVANSKVWECIIGLLIVKVSTLGKARANGYSDVLTAE